jgi:uncharacterized phiE125 gp8 family phage protein
MNAFPRRTAGPSIEPITLARALFHLKVEADGGEGDEYIADLIKAARQACEERTERTLITTTWLLTLDAFPDAIMLRQPPIIAVQSIDYVDEAGLVQTLDPADYKVDNVSEPGYVVPAFEKAWPATRSEINAVRVSYTAGYGDAASSVPMPLIQWMLLAIGDMNENRNASAERPTVQHNFVKHLLDPYCMVGC